MKRGTLCAVLALLLAVLAACGGPDPAAEGDLSGDEKLIVIGMSQVGAESDWRVANSESMKSVFTEERGYQLLFEDAKQKQENQIAAIRKFIQQQVDYIVLMPIREGGWESVLQEAKEAGIPVILVDRMVDVEDESLYAAHVGSDFRSGGQRAADWLEQRYGRTGEDVKILHIQGTPESTAQIARTAALEQAVARRENWELLAQLDGGFTQAKTYEAVQDYLSRAGSGTDIDVVYCENDNEAFGAIQALEENGYTCGEGGVALVSFDATRGGLTLCLEGKIALAVECNPLLGPLVEQVIQTLEAGGVPEKNYYVEETCFTPDMLTQEMIDQREY